MQISDTPFATTDRSQIERTEHPGETGRAYWPTQNFGGIRVRMVEYTPGYRADHWCIKSHILLCLEGQLETELKDGRRFTLKPGISYQVADNAELHRSSTAVGCQIVHCRLKTTAESHWPQWLADRKRASERISGSSTRQSVSFTSGPPVPHLIQGLLESFVRFLEDRICWRTPD